MVGAVTSRAAGLGGGRTAPQIPSSVGRVSFGDTDEDGTLSQSNLEVENILLESKDADQFSIAKVNQKEVEEKGKEKRGKQPTPAAVMATRPC